MTIEAGIPFLLDPHRFLSIRCHAQMDQTIHWDVRCGKPISVHLVDSENFTLSEENTDWEYAAGLSNRKVHQLDYTVIDSDEWVLLIMNDTDHTVPAIYGVWID